MVDVRDGEVTSEGQETSAMGDVRIALLLLAVRCADDSAWWMPTSSPWKALEGNLLLWYCKGAIFLLEFVSLLHPRKYC